MTVGGVSVEVVRKPIKSLRFAVQPPDGAVCISAPLDLSDDVVRLAVVNRLPWIKRQQATFRAQPRQSARQMVSGETHYVFGRACRLKVLVEDGPLRVSSVRKGEVTMRARGETTAVQRERAMQAWYRQRLREIVPPLVSKWERLLGVKASAVGIKRMKTRWGTCNTRARRIWLNLELAKMPQRCLEYIVAHELLHLVERTHSARFVQLLGRHMPRWKAYREELNTTPLAHQHWGSRTS
jgi:predicted metal-dependent hydrolase